MKLILAIRLYFAGLTLAQAERNRDLLAVEIPRLRAEVQALQDRLCAVKLEQTT